MLKNRTALNYFGAAALLFFLGTGNVIYGKHKHKEYLGLLSEARSRLASPQAAVTLPVPGPTVAMDQQLQSLKRLEARRDLYAFVVTGGQFFLVISAVLFVFFLTAFRREQVPPT
jgi:hypothetical protein